MNKEELKAELKRLEETPFYIGKDGMPSIPLILFVLVTGILPGLILAIAYRKFRIYLVRKQINQ